MKIGQIITLFLSCSFFPLSAQNVCSLGEKSYASIQDAVNEVGKGGTIKVLADVKLTSTIQVSSTTPAFTLDLNGHVLDGSMIPMPDGENTFTGDIIQNLGDLTIIDSNPDAVHADSLSAIKGGIMTGGKGEFYRIEDGSHAKNRGGGAIFSSGKLSITGISFFRNSAFWAGSVFSRKGTLTVSDCHFIENRADDSGSSIATSNGHTTITGCTITGGYAPFGAIVPQNDTLTINNCIFSGNEAENYGGGVYSSRANSLITINGCTFSDNSAENGGAIYVRGCQVKVANSTFNGNSALYGGACSVYKDSDITFTSCIFTDNSASEEGGGISHYAGRLSLEKCELTGNTCGRQGGAVITIGTLYMEDCKVTGNTSSTAFPSAGVYSWGGECHLKGKMIIKDNTTDGKPANLCLSGDFSCSQSVIDGMAEGSEVGVSSEWEDNVGAYRFTTNGTANDVKYFTSDNSLYTIGYNADGYLETIPAADCPMVCSIGDKKYPTVQNAVVAVSSGETIKIIDDLKLTSAISISSSTPAFTLDLNGHVLDGSNIHENHYYREIIYNNGDLTIIDSNPDAVHTDSLSAIKGGVLTGGHGRYMEEDFLPEIFNVKWESGTYGGAIFSTGKLKVTGVTFFHNTCEYAGGAIACLQNNTSINNCHFIENSTVGEGGDGGAVCFIGGGNYAISNSTFDGNYADLNGGAIAYKYNTSKSEGLTVTNCQFKQNDGCWGGAISCHETFKNTITGCTFEENTAVCGGGLLFDGSVASMKECIVSNNSAEEGNGISVYYDCKLTMKDCSITDNPSSSSTYVSAGIFMVDSECDLKGKMIIKGNTSDGKQSNLYLNSVFGESISVIDGLSEGSEIGVSAAFDYKDGVYRFTTNGTADDVKYFTSDNSFYSIGYNADGYLETLPAAGCPLACSIGDKGYPTVQNAVRVVKEGETVKVLEDVELTSTIKVSEEIPAFTLDLNGHVLDGSLIPMPDGEDSYLGNIIENKGDLTIVDSNPDAVHTDSLSGIKGGVLTGGKGEYYDLDGNYVSDYLAGGAIYSCGKLTLKGITFFKNSAFWGGAVMVNSGTLTMSDCYCFENTAESLGSSVCSGFGNTSIKGCTFKDGKADNGTIYAIQDTLTMDNCIVSGNEAKYGGGVFSNSKNNYITLNECTFSNNTSKNGGALFADECQMRVIGCTFNDNHSVLGGACEIINNSDVSFTNCIYTGNSSEKDGGALCISSSTVMLTKCELTGNSSNTQGGAISATTNSKCTLIMEDCKVTGNTSVSTYPSAGVYLWGTDCYLKGVMNIKGNTSNGKSANLCLSGEDSCNQVTINGLKEGTEIGVSTELSDVEGACRFTTNGTADDLKFFTSDSRLYKVNYNAEGYLETLADPTAINNVSDTESEASEIYDLCGRKIAADKLNNGVYIINGKKTIIR